MEYPLEISVTAPFDIGDQVAQIEFEGGSSAKVVLRGGSFCEPQPLRPVKMTLTLDMPDVDEQQEPARARALAGRAVDLNELFVSGVKIPSDGRLNVQVIWGCHCHSDVLPHQPAAKRFGSWEHIRCADFIGKQSVGDNAEKLRIGGVEASFDCTSGLRVGDHDLTFGQIVCLAGDYYAHFDAQARGDFAQAWPPLGLVGGWLEGGDYRETTLDVDEPVHIDNLLTIIRRDKDGDSGWLGEFAHAGDAVRGKYPARRYLALSAQNYCHFVSPGPRGQEPTPDFALWLYRQYHQRALALARKSSSDINPDRAFRVALAVDAFGCHFLTDHFAGGHLRVPRRLLGETYGVLRGSLRMSLSMHTEDNKIGLWCRSRRPRRDGTRIVWQAYGDGMLLRDEARHNLYQVQEAVRRSAAEMFAASRNTTLDELERADAIVPVPLPPGSGPRLNDRLPDNSPPPVDAPNNSYPMYWFDEDGRVLVRRGHSWHQEYECRHWGRRVAGVPMPFETNI
jgi:hypothetical protein